MNEDKKKTQIRISVIIGRLAVVVVVVGERLWLHYRLKTCLSYCSTSTTDSRIIKYDRGDQTGGDVGGSE